jgi:hypothetical protein
MTDINPAKSSGRALSMMNAMLSGKSSCGETDMSEYQGSMIELLCRQVT